eukprot:scaffold26856_cov140-Isochrysis_galbana.AAC.5
MNINIHTQAAGTRVRCETHTDHNHRVSASDDGLTDHMRPSSLTDKNAAMHMTHSYTSKSTYRRSDHAHPPLPCLRLLTAVLPCRVPCVRTRPAACLPRVCGFARGPRSAPVWPCVHGTPANSVHVAAMRQARWRSRDIAEIPARTSRDTAEICNMHNTAEGAGYSAPPACPTTPAASARTPP